MQELYYPGFSRNQTRGEDRCSQGPRKGLCIGAQVLAMLPASVWYLDHESLRHTDHELGGNSISQFRGRSMQHVAS